VIGLKTFRKLVVGYLQTGFLSAESYFANNF
jgi:hypothetical protein